MFDPMASGHILLTSLKQCIHRSLNEYHIDHSDPCCPAHTLWLTPILPVACTSTLILPTLKWHSKCHHDDRGKGSGLERRKRARYVYISICVDVQWLWVMDTPWPCLKRERGWRCNGSPRSRPNLNGFGHQKGRPRYDVQGIPPGIEADGGRQAGGSDQVEAGKAEEAISKVTARNPNHARLQPLQYRQFCGLSKRNGFQMLSHSLSLPTLHGVRWHVTW